MYFNSGYLNNSRVDFMEKKKPLIVGSCGMYQLRTKEKLPTYRPKGRIDYQLLYIASGKAHFFFEGKEEVVSAGHMVLYYPREVQKYIYYGAEQTEVYWVHFTGKEVKQILKTHGISMKGHVFYTGTSPEYQKIFRTMIQEIQLCKPHYEDLLETLLRQIFIMISREYAIEKIENGYAQKEIEKATLYFNEHYNENISIEDYAASKNMSICWFIRNFKEYNKITPMQYILTVRIANAKSLLETTSYNITEIAEIVGYDNPLYFSRLFKRQTGMSPSGYRKQKIMENA